MMKRLALALFAWLVLTALCGASLGASDLTAESQAIAGRKSYDGPEPSVASNRLARLRRGINLSHWFAQSPGGDYSENHLRTYDTARDMSLIKSIGFDHVRLAIEPAPLFDESDPTRLKPEYLRHLDSALDMILASGLSVIVDVHPSDEFKIRLRSDDSHVAAFISFWRLLATHLSGRDPERVFLEILNEPMVEDAYRWMGIQARLAAAIREGAARHTIIATGPRWSSVDQLLLIEPLADRNVIYNFHLYDPHTFTHQGATWGADYWPYLKGIPYPSSPETIYGLLAGIENAPARLALAAYGEERWNALRIERLVALASDWARRRNVPLMCNEFGVYRAYAPVTARLMWIEDVRTIFERHGIGWTMWDYAGGFGVVITKDGRRIADPQTVAALGLLRMPKAAGR